MSKINSYDIIAEEVRKFWKKTYPQDVIAFFYQKYDYENKWEQCNELISPEGYNNYYDVEFETDFCEGQTDVKDIYIVSLDEILEFYRKHIIDKNEK